MILRSSSALAKGMQMQTLSRCNKEDPADCDCYQAGKEVTELPCQGCSHYQRLHEQWARFEEDVDDVAPPVIRQIIVLGTGNSTEGWQQVEADLHTSTVNFLQPLSCQQLAEVQKDDPVLSVLHGWKGSGILTTREQVTKENPAVRKYWLCWPQIEIHQGVLLYS